MRQLQPIVVHSASSCQKPYGETTLTICTGDCSILWYNLSYWPEVFLASTAVFCSILGQANAELPRTFRYVFWRNFALLSAAEHQSDITSGTSVQQDLRAPSAWAPRGIVSPKNGRNLRSLLPRSLLPRKTYYSRHAMRMLPRLWALRFVSVCVTQSIYTGIQCQSILSLHSWRLLRSFPLCNPSSRGVSQHWSNYKTTTRTLL